MSRCATRRVAGRLGPAACWDPENPFIKNTGGGAGGWGGWGAGEQTKQRIANLPATAADKGTCARRAQSFYTSLKLVALVQAGHEADFANIGLATSLVDLVRPI